ncbi:RecQ-mediated genome instability protein 1 [Schistosoma bovis]|uniref:RecQ-mediated genome instability protein 1 n=1 Tax=Schistosoma bovis TaxID=6184 RepID=A0A430QDM3_SCHBO|nr:RecQ-mediated genome instability protein 1 [Schistosoma bovis]
MVTSFISTLNINTGVAQLSAWLTSQAIHVPPGWIDACVAWLAEEHGGIDACNHLTKSDWCQLIYEQWLHSDLKQLECPVLPSTISTSRNPHDNSLSSGTDANTMNSPALKLDGELCLQVVNLFNIGESYYGQLRRHEGNLSVNLPSLEVDGENNLDGHTTQMTQAFSQYLNQSPTQTNNFRQSTMANCLTLFLTDGVNEIKVIEFGTQSTRSRSSLPFKELSKKLRPGVKIRLRGPLLLRNNVLLVPPGALQSLSSHQLEVLGGEVDELLENYEENTMYEVGKLLANKLNIPLTENNSLPSWFPRVSSRQLRGSAGDNLLPSIEVPNEQSNYVPDVQQNRDNNISNSGNGRDPLSSVRYPLSTASTGDRGVVGGSGSVSPELWDDEIFDDAILSVSIPRSSVHSFNDPLRLPTSVISDERERLSNESKFSGLQRTHSVVDESENNVSIDNDDPFLEDQVDPDILASALAEIDEQQSMNSTNFPKTNQLKGNEMRIFQSNKNVSETTATSSTLSSTLMKTSTVSQPIKSQIESKQKPVKPDIKKVQTNIDNNEDLLPPVPKRKTLEFKQTNSTIGSNSKSKNILQFASSSSHQIVSMATEDNHDKHMVSSRQLSSNSLEVDYHFHPFCYIQDIYDKLLKTKDSSNGSASINTVYTIRGLLISLLSSLEHHNGTKWTLAVRITDGSAILDLDVASDLLTEWIGLTPSESESLRRLSKIDSDSSNPLALQEVSVIFFFHPV